MASTNDDPSPRRRIRRQPHPDCPDRTKVDVTVMTAPPSSAMAATAASQSGSSCVTDTAPRPMPR
jgi:hypothetical protein